MKIKDKDKIAWMSRYALVDAGFYPSNSVFTFNINNENTVICKKNNVEDMMI